MNFMIHFCHVVYHVFFQEKWDQPNRIWDDLGSANGPRISRLIKTYQGYVTKRFGGKPTWISSYKHCKLT